MYFAWGETTGYTADDVTSGVRAFSEDVYNAGPAASISTNLTLEQDAAHVNLGGNWRMPTKAELQELIDNCDVTWTDDYNRTGVKGSIFTSRVNGNSIFFPAAGYGYYSHMYDVGSVGKYWSASLASSGYANSLRLEINNITTNFSSSINGYSVRAVCE